MIAVKDTEVQVHYKGWKSKFDEWINKDDEKRLAPLFTHTDRPLKCGHVPAQLHTKCDAKDTTDKWLVAEIVEVVPEHNLVKIHYGNPKYIYIYTGIYI